MGIFSKLPESTVYFSYLLGTKIYTQTGFFLGTFRDVFVDYESVYPEVLAVQLRKNQKYFYIAWEDIQKFSYKKIIIKDQAEIRQGEVYPKVKEPKVIKSFLANQYQSTTVDYPSLGKTILDRQVVDVSGKKVVRVNDIFFLKLGGNLRITHVAVGLSSMVRRLGYGPFFKWLEKFIPKIKSMFDKEVVINWKFVHAVPGKNIQKNVKLNISESPLEELHPADLADILEDLDSFGRKHLFDQLDPEMKAKTLSEVEDDFQESLIGDDSAEDVAEIIENMGPDEAADFLHELDENKAEEIISKIEDDEHQEEIQELLAYDENTAGGIMTTEVLDVRPHHNRNDILKMIQENHEDLETIYDIYVTDENERLLGTCSLRDLIIQKENIKIEELMESKDFKYLHPEEEWEEIAEFMSKYNLINVPILAKESFELLGVVSVDDILPWILEEKR